MAIRYFRICAGAAAGTLFATAVLAGPHHLEWKDLRPEGQPAYAMAGPLGARPDEKAAALAWQQGDEEVEIAGFLLPFDREGDMIYAFMLLPWTGACSHTPPPPSNQVVLVYPDRPYRAAEIYEPVTVRGRLAPGLERTQLMILDGVRVIESGYSIGKAQVEKATSVPDGLTAPGTANPWTFLKG